MKHKNKHLAILLIFIGSFFLTDVGQAQTKPYKYKKGNELRLLVIGNSFSKDATLYLPQLASEGGHKLVIQKAEIGGSPLKRHWDAVEIAEANPDDPKGKRYGGKSLKMLLSDGKWDIVTMQQVSSSSADPDTYQPYIKYLYDFVKKFQPDAEIVLHQTWAYRNDAKAFSKIAGETRAADQKEMWEKSRAAYHKIAGELGLRIIPVGDAFWKVSSDPKWAYIKDPAFDFNNPVHPNMPNQQNSLNIGYKWSKDKTLKLDANHANSAGSYLGGLVWYGFLFNESPVNLKFVPENLDADFAKHLRSTAGKTLQENAKRK